MNPWLSFRCGSHSLACPGTGTWSLCGALLLGSAAHRTTSTFPVRKCSVKRSLSWFLVPEVGRFFPPYFVSCQSSGVIDVGGSLSGKKVHSCSQKFHLLFCSTSFSAPRFLSPLVETRLPWNVIWFLFLGKMGVIYCSRKSWKLGDWSQEIWVSVPVLPTLQWDPSYFTSPSTYFCICGVKDWAG